MMTFTQTGQTGIIKISESLLEKLVLCSQSVVFYSGVQLLTDLMGLIHRLLPVVQFFIQVSFLFTKQILENNNKATVLDLHRMENPIHQVCSFALDICENLLRGWGGSDFVVRMRYLRPR